MNRDAKIGIVVILIIVGFLVIIWGRGEPKDTPINAGPTTPGMPTTDVEGRTNTRAGGTLEVASPPGAEMVDPALLPALPEPPRTEATAPPTTTTEPGPTASNTTTTEPPSTEPAPEFWTYVVKKGDAGELIAREQLGDGRRWTEVAALNNMDRNATLHIGQKLKMPPKGTVAAPTNGHETATTSSRVQPAGTVVYTVTQYDIGLIQIAEEQLGDKSRWKEIAQLNHLVEPYRILVGQKLFLPKK